jgi:hypothetical protein
MDFEDYKYNIMRSATEIYAGMVSNPNLAKLSSPEGGSQIKVNTKAILAKEAVEAALLLHEQIADLEEVLDESDKKIEKKKGGTYVGKRR